MFIVGEGWGVELCWSASTFCQILHCWCDSYSWPPANQILLALQYTYWEIYIHTLYCSELSVLPHDVCNWQWWVKYVSEQCLKLVRYLTYVLPHRYVQQQVMGMLSQPNSTSTQVGSDKVLSRTTTPPLHPLKLLRYFHFRNSTSI